MTELTNLPAHWTSLAGRTLKAGGQATVFPIRHDDGREGVFREMRLSPRETLGQGQAILDFYARQGGGYPMGVSQLSESDAVDALRLPFYSSSHPTGSHGWRNQFDLGNPE